jgi:heme exporter protein D
MMLVLGLGARAPFIIGSYAAAAVVLAALVIWLILDGRRQQRLLDEIEARGVRRRSARGASATTRQSEAGHD